MSHLIYRIDTHTFHGSSIVVESFPSREQEGRRKVIPLGVNTESLGNEESTNFSWESHT